MRKRPLIAHAIALLSAVTMLSLPSIALADPTINYNLRDCGISSLSGSSQTVVSASNTRKYLSIFNTGNASIYLNASGGTAATTGIASIIIPSGSSLVMVGSSAWGVPRNAMTVIGTAGQPVTCLEGN